LPVGSQCAVWDEAEGVTVPMGNYPLGLNPFLLIIITSLKNACYLWIEGVAKVSKK
jgi:hypothetical protein